MSSEVPEDWMTNDESDTESVEGTDDQVPDGVPGRYVGDKEDWWLLREFPDDRFPNGRPDEMNWRGLRFKHMQRTFPGPDVDGNYLLDRVVDYVHVLWPESDPTPHYMYVVVWTG